MELQNGYYTGDKKDIVQSYSYFITIKDTIASIEYYRVYKGETITYNFFENKRKIPSSEQFVIRNGTNNYILNNSSNLSFSIISDGNRIILDHPKKIVLQKVDSFPQEYMSMKNLSLYDFSWNAPHIILGYDKELNAVKEREIINKIGESKLKEKCYDLEYKDYKELIYRTLNEFNKDS